MKVGSLSGLISSERYGYEKKLNRFLGEVEFHIIRGLSHCNGRGWSNDHPDGLRITMRAAIRKEMTKVTVIASGMWSSPGQPNAMFIERHLFQVETFSHYTPAGNFELS